MLDSADSVSDTLSVDAISVAGDTVLKIVMVLVEIEMDDGELTPAPIIASGFLHTSASAK